MIGPLLLMSLLLQGSAPQARAQQSDSLFEHSRHKALACLDCHSTSKSHVGLKIMVPSGCLGCHHGPAQRAACATCHAAGPTVQKAVPVNFKVSSRRDAVTRAVSFSHARHGAVDCAKCHAADLTRTVAAPTCNGCHEDHHGAARDCAACHPTARAGHDRTVHEGCAGCHTDARVAALATSRSLCLSCHQEQRIRHPAGECSTCHAVALHTGAKAGRPQ